MVNPRASASVLGLHTWTITTTHSCFSPFETFFFFHSLWKCQIQNHTLLLRDRLLCEHFISNTQINLFLKMDLPLCGSKGPFFNVDVSHFGGIVKVSIVGILRGAALLWVVASNNERTSAELNSCNWAGILSCVPISPWHLLMRATARTLRWDYYGCKEEAKTLQRWRQKQNCSSLTHKHNEKGKRRHDMQIVGGNYLFHCTPYLCSLKRSKAEMQSEATVFTWWRENWDLWGRTEVKPMAENINNHLREHRWQAEWQRHIYIKHLHHCDWQKPLWFCTNGVFISQGLEMRLSWGADNAGWFSMANVSRMSMYRNYGTKRLLEILYSFVTFLRWYMHRKEARRIPGPTLCQAVLWPLMK